MKKKKVNQTPVPKRRPKTHQRPIPKSINVIETKEKDTTTTKGKHLNRENKTDSSPAIRTLPPAPKRRKHPTYQLYT